MTKGDRIYVYRNLWQLDGLYQHHGIDCGDGTVIHYRKPSETIERTSLETFSRGNPVYVAEYGDGFGYIPDAVVERAESRLGEHKYNLLFNNCEHFASWCKTGVSQSQQVKDFVPLIHKLDPSKLYEPIRQALKGKDSNTAQELLAESLADIKSIWEQVQPQYQEAVEEVSAWDRVAKKALKSDREDLARAAIAKKLHYQRQASKLEIELSELAA
ncbi:lecithin retinol acyltransferase family protein [Waterburya agarophytonicola K14]|uniref:Lecithin retinol acyltransferase family protein n=1 Tax=Waterburya agarophytonicola KI4 TaxID=2874699 RepID=A0A964BQP6_9CYAN|nr:lecithin retinol acyltransferase family protein [Waterburya agarophytonicola]MCC0177843.1 lecithin retinol acyltransferase family protein [Waterburya agarophytonicola KI4]